MRETTMIRFAGRAARRCGNAFAFAAAFATLVASRTAEAQSIAVNAGSTSQIFVLPGSTVSVPIQVDLTNANPLNIASLSTGITWGTLAGGLAMTSLVVGPTGWAFVPNTGGSGSGSVSFTTSNATSLLTTSTVATISFSANEGTPGAQRGTRLVIAPTAAANQALQSVLSSLRPRMLEICVAISGRRGDVTDNGVVDIADAQQIARNVVGLSVANANAFAKGRGDVTGSDGTNIVDAQQIARFSVSLSTPGAPQMNADMLTPPAVTTHTITPGTNPTIGLGETVQLTNTPRAAGNVDLTGCSGTTWETSNAAVATVNASGLVTGVAAGSAIITARSAVNTNITATRTVNVTGIVATQLALTTAPAGAVSGSPFGTQPVVQIRTAGNQLVNTATNAVTATLTSGTGALLGTAVVNAIGGVATFTSLRLDLAGAKTLTFTSPGLTQAVSPSFSVTAGSLASINVVLGNAAPALNGSTTATATGADAAGNAVVISPTWSTNDFRKARVTNAGAVQAIGSGAVNITAAVGAINGSAVMNAPAAAGGFTITMHNVVALSSTVQTAFTNAANRWAQIIRGDLPSATVNSDISGCANGVAGPIVPGVIDDVFIIVNVAPGDGVGGVLGSAGPCLIRVSGSLTVAGSMSFDSFDLDNLESSGRLEAVIMHEMGHVLGIGTLWEDLGLLLNKAPDTPDPAGDPTFGGINGQWAFQNLGTGYGGAVVPVENCCNPQGTRNGHWREAVLARELMTGFVSASGQPNPLSPLTAASLIDMGYLVDVNASDPTPYFLMAPGSMGEVFDLHKHMLPTTMRMRVDTNGRMIGPVRTDTSSVRR